MTGVTFFEREDGCLTGFEAIGHSGYGEYGSDIVCAAISALTQAASQGLAEVAGAPVSSVTDEGAGYLSCVIQPGATHRQLADAQILLKTLKLALTAISNDYPGTIRIIIRERR